MSRYSRCRYVVGREISPIGCSLFRIGALIDVLKHRPVLHGGTITMTFTDSEALDETDP